MNERINKIIKKQKALEYEFLKVKVSDLERKNNNLEKELKDVKMGMNRIWALVQRLASIRPEAALPEDVSPIPKDFFTPEISKE